MSEKRSGCCLWRLVKFLLILLLLGGTGYWVYTTFFCVESERVDYYKEPIDEEEMRVPESHYDYSELAKSITTGCVDDYQRVRAIYQWICDHIDYDTSYTIHRADSCIDAKRGVCQAYCELFYYLAKAVGVRTEIISGKSKGHDGTIGKDGHSWLFAYTREDHGILLDPTWGAGTVDGKTFTRSKNYWTWFNVNPEWMILSHFPEYESYQLINSPLSMEEFLAMVPANNLWMEYGADVHKIFKKSRKQTLAMPNFYNGGEGVFEIVDVPLCEALQVGESYTFRIKMKQNKRFAIIHNGVFTEVDEWEDEGDGVYSIHFVPKGIGSLYFGIKADSGNRWNYIIGYRVDEHVPSAWRDTDEPFSHGIPPMEEVGHFLGDVCEEVTMEVGKWIKQIKDKLN